MGKRRKSAKRQTTKKAPSAVKTFKCPYCAHDDACEVKLDRATETGRILCRICAEEFQCRISYLSDPVDVFCEWVDACERARTEEAGGSGSGGRGEGVGTGGGNEEDEEEGGGNKTQ